MGTYTSLGYIWPFEPVGTKHTHCQQTQIYTGQQYKLKHFILKENILYIKAFNT